VVHFRPEHSRKRAFSGISPNLDHREPRLADCQQMLAEHPFRESQPSWPAHRSRFVVGQRRPIAAPQAALCGDRALAAGADMPTMIATGQHLATRSKKRQSARVPRDQTPAAALRPICPLIDPLVWGIARSTSCAGAGRPAGSRYSTSRWPRLPIAARRPAHRYPSVERIQKPLRESPFEMSGFRAAPKADRL
jgi:hypothetical protein